MVQSTDTAVEAVISIQGFTKRYGDIVAVNNLSLEIPEGAICGLLGPNGAGKTTTFRVLCGYLRPTAGVVNICGFPPGHPQLQHGKLAALPQDAMLPGYFTVMEFLVYMGELQHLGPAQAKAEAMCTLEVVGLQADGQRIIRSLSHGMARRVALASCFLGTPRLLLLDEPTSGLDPRHAHELRELIKSYKGKSSVLLASHNLAEVQQVCDHVAIVDKGTLVASGTVAEICRVTQSLVIELGGGTVDTAALTAALGLPVRWVPERQAVTIEAPADSGRDLDQLTATALRYLLDQRLPIRGVRRGESLEKRYLELT